jgi:hypothetical protein
MWVRGTSAASRVGGAGSDEESSLILYPSGMPRLQFIITGRTLSFIRCPILKNGALVYSEAFQNLLIGAGRDNFRQGLTLDLREPCFVSGG